MRNLPEWKRYIRAIENGNHRAHLQEVDFYDISFVWERYYEWLEAARQQADTVLWKSAWKEEPGAVSILYRMGNTEILTVYTGDRAPVKIRAELGMDPQVPDNKDHTVLLTIDFICADVLEHPLEQTPMLAELRLFEGITREKMSEVYKSILKRLISRPFTWIPYQEEMEAREYYIKKSESPEWRMRLEMLQEDQEAYDREKYLRIKKNSDEWIRYHALMEQRPDQFAQDEMLTIVTDLKEICDYERKHHRTIGVRYHNEPYSMMVVDLVRDMKGNCYTYERSLPCVSRGAVVCVTFWEGRYVLLRQFRHSLRGYQISFPRGYGENGISAEDNARKEVREELGTEVLSLRRLGEIVADSGLNGNHVEVFFCEISQPRLKKGYEGIKQLVFYTEEEMRSQIENGAINDGFTLGALSLYQGTVLWRV